MKRIFALFLFALFVLSSNIHAQELRCNVQLVTQQIQGSNKQVFRTLQTAIYEFMNNQSWTQNVFDPNEQIECNILINLKEQSGDKYRGSIQVQSRRPVYNSTYSTTVFNFMDNNFDITYVEYQPLDFDVNQHLSNLTSILAFYAYMIIGLDYDTFAPEGGTEFLQKAEAVVINAQNAAEAGWKAFGTSGNRNRYWLSQNIMDDQYRPVRNYLYTYHRLGMDKMESNVNVARDQIEESLKYLQGVFRNQPDSYLFLLQVMFDAKSDEYVDIFKGSFPDQQRRVFLILKEINPSNIKIYETISQSSG
ncbi:MAG: DUF4835 family protein [Bacteroidales bacterium]|nr:DUF4835 family protein [Bacteroidales bacterium]